MTSLLNAREALIKFQDSEDFERLSDRELEQWSQIVGCFISADRWAKEDFGEQVSSKQLTLPLTL